MKKTSRTDFDFVIDDEFLIITDLNYGNMSVTNDIENVLFDIRQQGIILSNYKILYQDSTENFDGILVNPKTEEFEDFFYIGASNISDAKRMYDTV